jgi:hypothetical protein
MFTSQFKKGLLLESDERVFFDSIQITKKMVCDAAILAITIASKLVGATSEKMSAELISLDSEWSARLVLCQLR